MQGHDNVVTNVLNNQQYCDFQHIVCEEFDNSPQECENTVKDKFKIKLLKSLLNFVINICRKTMMLKSLVIELLNPIEMLNL